MGARFYAAGASAVKKATACYLAPMKISMASRFWPLGLLLLAWPASAQLLQPGWFSDARTGCKIWN